uniref:C3H1-type domain-containing protein n=1 Tax=Tetradesmus obliquus TaxID=3088 RepID=A0A383WIU5_TETOB|eukprot:jgi/Sobl393_1/14428/SZX77142.1
MAPKAAAAKEADKARQKAKAKQAEDKTFGLKNKNKSAKVQKYVQGVTSTVGGISAKDKRAQELAEKAKKEKKAAEEARKKELAELFASAIKQPKVPAGVDPKSVVCEFFRHGRCDKGFKCKYAHDLSVERKTAKIDLFTDQRELGKEGDEVRRSSAASAVVATAADAAARAGQQRQQRQQRQQQQPQQQHSVTAWRSEQGMEDWDQETLEKVVREKHGAEKPSNTTNIICKFFLDAVEKRQYGWFWKCPNGSDCKYKHALPPGYVLKSQMKELLELERANAKDIAEVIEEERAKVEARTPITEQVFAAWHAKKRADREAKRAAELEERKKKGLLNGREIFLSDNFVALDDANAGDDDEYKREDDEEARINDMFDQARKAQEAARAAAGPTDEEQQAAADGAGSSAAAANGGASSSSAAAAGTTLQLNAADAALFDDDDDDDEVLDDDDDGDLDADELEQLEQQLQGASVS